MKIWWDNNFWLKLIALVLAVITWFFISGELSRKQADFYLQSANISIP